MDNNKNGTLYIIATPIGNAQDITLRALNKLNTLELIACEDTRVTSKLCNIHKISSKGRLLAYHEHNSKKMIQIIIKLLKKGKNVLCVAHGNALRAFRIATKEYTEENIFNID